MLTCIINQFDCKEGTKGKAFCMSVGKLNVENPAKKRVIGVAIEPIKRLFVWNSKNKWIVKIPQLKKIKDDNFSIKRMGTIISWKVIKITNSKMRWKALKYYKLMPTIKYNNKNK